ncbi:hypothetical protein EJ05DRAFT_519691 [Pseudovirgaria hyperparasitica]|uniref:Uncharacterized protein n=1 Tax=Pseudovirgaria hyperparasitica TaxID=470096 RepID=A0A6A6VZ59_9PEZI|nr:uncharacterized protein EJ05DRAFT_519691 [Pseudovirgaria hyperparasitica]KAF2754980.1 hypothetical protein EJ05DRAFT_519691 [Pseudovirgaria hyperparasitica]
MYHPTSEQNWEFQINPESPYSNTQQPGQPYYGASGMNSSSPVIEPSPRHIHGLPKYEANIGIGTGQLSQDDLNNFDFKIAKALQVQGGIDHLSPDDRSSFGNIMQNTEFKMSDQQQTMNHASHYTLQLQRQQTELHMQQLQQRQQQQRQWRQQQQQNAFNHQRFQQIIQNNSAATPLSGTPMDFQTQDRHNAASYQNETPSSSFIPNDELTNFGVRERYNSTALMNSPEPLLHIAIPPSENGFCNFQGPVQAKAYIDERKHWKNQDTNAPLTDQELRPYAEAIFEAMISIGKDKYRPKVPDPKHWGAGQWTLRQIEARAWHVADLTAKLHRLGDNMWVAQGCKSRISMRDTQLSFVERIDLICKILRKMHNTCTEVMNGQKLDILIPGPNKLMKRIISNASGNEKKKGLLETGKKAKARGWAIDFGEEEDEDAEGEGEEDGDEEYVEETVEVEDSPSLRSSRATAERGRRLRLGLRVDGDLAHKSRSTT